jgi:hypothetical protein
MRFEVFLRLTVPYFFESGRNLDHVDELGFIHDDLLPVRARALSVRSAVFLELTDRAFIDFLLGSGNGISRAPPHRNEIGLFQQRHTLAGGLPGDFQPFTESAGVWPSSSRSRSSQGPLRGAARAWNAALTTHYMQPRLLRPSHMHGR